MSRLTKIQRDHAAADLAAVEVMIERLSDDDAVTRMSLEERRDELMEALEIEPELETTAAAALYFSGRPVIGDLGIESEFGGKALSIFQDLVAKEFAQETVGLAQRGVVPNKAATRLHITNIVRGSFGFRLEELSDQIPMMDSALKTAVARALVLMKAFAYDADEQFQEQIEATDQRILDTAKQFFRLMHDEDAKFRAITEEFDKSFNSEAIGRAFERAQMTAVEDTEETVSGTLLGVLPEGHQFEFRRDAPPGVIRGRAERELSADLLASFNRDWLERPSVALVSVRRVLREGEVVREKFVLKGLRDQEREA